MPRPEDKEPQGQGRGLDPDRLRGEERSAEVQARNEERKSVHDAEKAAAAQEREDRQEQKKAEQEVKKMEKSGLENPESLMKDQEARDKAAAEGRGVAVRPAGAVVTAPAGDADMATRQVATYRAKSEKYRVDAKTLENLRRQDEANECLRKAAEYDRLAEQAGIAGGIA